MENSYLNYTPTYEDIVWKDYYIIAQDEYGWLVMPRRPEAIYTDYIPYPDKETTIDDFKALLELYKL